MSEVRLTGGCQCGAVRYALLKQPERPSICHCRMCQKAMGNVIAVFAGVEPAFFELTRGTLTPFRTSDTAERCFCNQCGTPLAWIQSDGSWIAVTIGSLDDPSAVPPVRYYGEEGRVPWIDEAVHHRGTHTGGSAGSDYEVANLRTNRQHPDHDTEFWPPAG